MIKVGVFSLTGCDGCQVVLLEAFGQLLALKDHIEFTSFPMLKDKNSKGPFDIAIIEGSVVKKDEIEQLKRIRKQSKVVIALGACATHGSVQAAKNFMEQDKVTHAVYPPGFVKDSTEVTGIGAHIKVDYEIWGCPPDANDAMRLIKRLMVGQEPRDVDDDPLCLECRALGHECLLQNGRMCLGPITHRGCNAICITAGDACDGCRGFLNNANVDALIGKLKLMGFTNEQIKDSMGKYMSNSKRTRKVIENGESN